jgi:hypothetical protein
VQEDFFWFKFATTLLASLGWGLTFTVLNGNLETGVYQGLSVTNVKTLLSLSLTSPFPM